jgi:hypothetical protein
LSKRSKNGISGPSTSQLLFADDSIFFTSINLKNINNLKSILQTYSQGSGPNINLQKSILFFGNHCPDPIKQQVIESLEVFNVASHSNYLGMPIYVGQSKPCVLILFMTACGGECRGGMIDPCQRLERKQC